MKKRKLLRNLAIIAVASITIAAPAFFAFSCSSDDDNSKPTPPETKPDTPEGSPDAPEGGPTPSPNPNPDVPEGDPTPPEITPPTPPTPPAPPSEIPKPDDGNPIVPPTPKPPQKTISIPNTEINNIKKIISNINNENITNTELLAQIKNETPLLGQYIENINIHYENEAPYKSANGSITLSPNNIYTINNNDTNISITNNTLAFNAILTKISNKYVAIINAPSMVNLKPEQSIDLNVTIEKINELNKLYPNWTGSWIKDKNKLFSNNNIYIDGSKNKHLQVIRANNQVQGIYQYVISLNDINHTEYKSNEFKLNVLDINDVPKPDPKFNNFYNDGYSAIGTYYQKIINPNVPRPTNVAMYQTELWTKYHDTYGFIYPGWNRNYEVGDNRYFYDNTHTNKIDAKNLVYDERVANTKYTYNNPDWITSEIANGTFKKHPAADNFYQSDISNLPAVEKEFVISTVNTGPTNLGLYVPPGEVVTIEFDQETFDYIQASNWNTNWDSMRFVVNQNFWDNEKDGDSGGISNRYPFIRSEFSIMYMDKQTRSLKIGSPFGGGLGIQIGHPLPLNHANFNDNSLPVKFKVSGAVQCVQYVDGYTTKTDWNNQINLFKQQKIAPVLQGDSAYFALSIPSTGIGEFGRVNVDNFCYPKASFKKWNDYLFLSNYYSRRDITNTNVAKLNMEFCDDIWGDAGAWGGGGNFIYCPVDWGANAIFSDNAVENFSPYNSWGVFHEINHNFQEDGAFFKKRGHGETNQVSLFNLSVIGDIGRYRNEMNYTGESNFKINDINNFGWERLDNPYINILSTLQRNWSDEYPLYANLLYFMGSKNYVDYVRWDVQNHNCESPNWNGLEEIRMLSENFKLNFWPTFEIYGKWWNDTWPTSYQNATVEQKAIIDNLNKYPAFDFIANMYAAGSYIYNSQNQAYVYGGDVLPAFEIVAGQPKQFDLNKFIISTNQNFKWDTLDFPNTSNLGSNITYNPKTKILTYNPKIENLGKIDEFDITIHPSNFLNKPANYVPGYKFKIKVKTIANCGTVESYKLSFFGGMHDLHVNKKPTMVVPYTRNGKYIFNEDKSKMARKVKFQFVAPETANYEFLAKWDDLYDLYVNDQRVYTSRFYNNSSFKKVYSIHLNKGDTLNFDNEILNLSAKGEFEMIVKSDVDPKINLFDNIVLNNLKTLNTGLSTEQVLEQKYVPRKINYSIFNSSQSRFINETSKEFPIIDPKKYILSSPTPQATNMVDNLNNYDSTWCEVWNELNGSNSAKLVIDMNTVNDERIDISSILMGCRYNNHWNARPTHIEIKINDENNNMITVYNGKYPTRDANFSYINLDKTYNTNKVQINMVNEKLNGISLWYLNFSSNAYIQQSNSIAFNNPNMTLSGNWNITTNNKENLSSLNDCYLSTDQENASVEFVLNNISDFDIIGQNNNLNAGFDVYINDQLYQHVDINSQKRKDNASLFSYHQDNPSLIKVKIVSTTNKKLFLNYIMTHGKGTSII